MFHVTSPMFQVPRFTFSHPRGAFIAKLNIVIYNSAMTSEHPHPDDPMSRLDREIFPVSFDPESGIAYVDPGRLPDFDESIFGKKQVAAILEHITPFYWSAVSLRTKLLSGTADKEAGETWEILMVGLEIHRMFFELLGNKAQIKGEEKEGIRTSAGWESWMHRIIEPQVSPLITEDNPELARQQLARIKDIKQRARDFLDNLPLEPEDDEGTEE